MSDTYKRRWGSHIDDLDRLRSNLTDGQEDVLDDVQDQLETLVDAAAKNREADDESDEDGPDRLDNPHWQDRMGDLR